MNMRLSKGKDILLSIPKQQCKDNRGDTVLYEMKKLNVVYFESFRK